MINEAWDSVLAARKSRQEWKPDSSRQGAKSAKFITIFFVAFASPGYAQHMLCGIFRFFWCGVAALCYYSFSQNVDGFNFAVYFYWQSRQ